jgi:hypothetical protein
MNPLDRLEDKRRDWRRVCAASADECARTLAARLAGFLPDPVGPLTAEQSARLAAAGDAARQWAETDLLPQCRNWLRESRLWPQSADSDEWIRRELVAALQELPAFEPPPPEPVPRLPAWSSALAAACGAMVGMLLATPLTLLLLGQREFGLFVGGILGSASLVALVNLLATAPQVRTAVASVVLVSGAGSIFAGVWSYWRNQSTGWLRGGLGLLATYLVIFLARPRLAWPARTPYVQQVAQQWRKHLGHVADLVLAWCWAHPSRWPSQGGGEQNRSPALPGPLCAALADLRRQLDSSEKTPADLRDSVEELLQRFEEDGYEWKSITANTPFEESMKEDFNTFGLIEPGQPVRTRRAALRHQGQLVRKGELRRV